MGWNTERFGCPACRTVTGERRDWESEFSTRPEMTEEQGQCGGPCAQCGTPVVFIPGGRWPDSGTAPGPEKNRK